MKLNPTEIAGPLGSKRITVGLSGGVDSVVLLHLLVQAGCDVRAAHIDHQLRSESGEDARFALGFAASLGIPFASAKIEVERGNSTHGRARAQRYSALVRLSLELGSDTLTVAHHADDAWESARLQSARGAGAVGVAGPRVHADWWGFDITRPLLFTRRALIERYARDHDLSWREDPSNHDPRYARTLIRDASAVDDVALADARDASDRLRARVAAIESVKSPTSVEFDRAELAVFDRETMGRALLDAARELHGELPGALVEEIAQATQDDHEQLRTFCGRRVTVDVCRTLVTVCASRGQGTRLNDRGGVRTVLLLPDAEYPWFAHRVETSSKAIPDGVWVPSGVALGTPIPGMRVDGTPVRELLRNMDVSERDRQNWPCIVLGDECLAVLGCGVRSTIADSPRTDGMFVRARRFSKC